MKTDPWKPLISAYQRPSAARASWQILNSVGVYIALWCAEQVTPMTVFRSIRAFSLKLWDEASGKLVGFRQLRLARQRDCA